MTNLELAATFDRIANLMEIKGEVIFKTLAYRKAAESLRSLGEDIQTVRQQGRLLDIPGVGKAIAEKITELLDTGRLEFLERLEQEVPPTLIEMLAVPDVGPRKVAMFWQQGITTLADLEFCARTGRLRNLPGMGEKSEARIVAGIEALGRRSTRMTLGSAWAAANIWLAWLRSQPSVERAEAAGSLRRWKTTIGDLDLVAASSRPAELMETFTHHSEVLQILGQGENKSSIETHTGLKLQLWVQPLERFGSLWLYATGSKDHNVRVRELAQKQGWSLSEQKMVKTSGEEKLCPQEADVYSTLGLAWIPPELREDRGEIEAARTGKLPRMLELGDLRADLHCHTTWSDGTASILEMAQAARSRGLSILAITDHSSGLGIAQGLTVERLYKQRAEIETVRQQMGSDFLLLHGSEVEIHADGSLDFPDDVLAWLDIVVASLHTSLRQPREVVTARLLKAIQNPHVDIIGHPSGRLLPDREGADLDWEAVLPAALENGTILEINANWHRLDLDEVHARRAAEMGIPLAINTDSHAADQFEQAVFGVSVARRAWVAPERIASTWTAGQLRAWLAARGNTG